jgi:hypothetical protein
MLACARIGAAAHGRLRRLLRRRAARPDQRRRGEGVITADGGYRRGKRRALKPAVDEARPRTPDVEQRARRRRTGRTSSGPRAATCGGTTSSTTADAEHTPRRSTPSTRSTSCTRRARPAKPKGILHTTGGYLTQVAYTHWASSTSSPTPTSTGARPTSAGSPATATSSTGRWRNGATSVMYEGTPGHPAPRPLVGDHREVQGHDPLHRADAIRTFMKWGEESRPARPVVAAAARLGRRADQPRGVDLVPRAHRRRPLPGRRHLVADRDRRDHDHPLPGVTDDQARLGDDAAARASRPTSSTTRATGAQRRAATSCSPSRGRRCCAASGATTSATRRPTGRGSRGCTSPATAPRRTRTATSGCSAGSTTS